MANFLQIKSHVLYMDHILDISCSNWQESWVKISIKLHGFNNPYNILFATEKDAEFIYDCIINVIDGKPSTHKFITNIP